MKMQVNRLKFYAAINLFSVYTIKNEYSFWNGQFPKTTFAQYFSMCKINFNMLLELHRSFCREQEKFVLLCYAML